MVEVLESYPRGGGPQMASSSANTAIINEEEPEETQTSRISSILNNNETNSKQQVSHLDSSVKFKVDDEDDEPVDANTETLNRTRYLRRSKTMPTNSSTTPPPVAPAASMRLNKSLTKENSMLTSSINLKLNVNPDRFKMAKEEAERAIKERKIFQIVGPYQSLRNALRRRGWVEKFDSSAANNSSNNHSSGSPKTGRLTAAKKKNSQSVDYDGSSSDDDAGDEVLEDNEETKPWEENNGYFSVVSRLLKSFSPNLIWTVKATTLDYPYLAKDQMVNHFNKNGAFTTKIGLCSNIRNIAWHSSENCDEFFPRCYKLCQDDDRKAFIDDYRITSCISLLKYFMIKYRNESEEDYLDVHITSAEELKNKIRKKEAASLEEEDDDDDEDDDNDDDEEVSHTSSRSVAALAAQKPIVKITPVVEEPQSQKHNNHKRSSSVSKSPSSKNLTSVPVEAIEFAIEQIDAFVDFKENNDLDKPELDTTGEDKWIKFAEWFYAACHDKKPFQPTSESLYHEVVKSLEVAKTYCTQYQIDGFRNIWIVKPGALSRGRGIIVFDKLENILELVRSPLQRDGKYVVQKYIERPLLIHKIKFDIRQWFLVTDFNPLTIWMYKDCYLRFCTQKFTLDTTKESVHLCNYSIQKNYKNDTARDQAVPDENMWSSSEFVDKYLTRRGLASKWPELIYPGMRQAILNAMLSSQDIVEARKNSFELYGADFMLGDDLKPWLIEINCSPTMAKSTEVTKVLCDVVLEDVCRVVLDRRANRNCDTGRFELIYKASPVSVPNYLGVDLKVDGFSYKKAQQQLSPQPQPQTQQQSTLASISLNRSMSISTSTVAAAATTTTTTTSAPVVVAPIAKPQITTTTAITNFLGSSQSNETINITSLEFKSPAAAAATTSSSKLISPANSLTLGGTRPSVLRQHTTLAYSSLGPKDTSSSSAAFPVISPAVSHAIKLARRESTVIASEPSTMTMSFLAGSSSVSKPLSMMTRSSMIDMRSRVTGVSEPRLFEFNQYQASHKTSNASNHPFVIKRASMPYKQLVKMSKTRNYEDTRFLTRNDFTTKLSKRMMLQRASNNKSRVVHANKQLMLTNKLDASDLAGIQFEK